MLFHPLAGYTEMKTSQVSNGVVILSLSAVLRGHVLETLLTYRWCFLGQNFEANEFEFKFSYGFQLCPSRTSPGTLVPSDSPKHAWGLNLKICWIEWCRKWNVYILDIHYILYELYDNFPKAPRFKMFGMSFKIFVDPYCFLSTHF